jgi:GH25 family lysozyme M1 (1,4-beta-N-acetylmuramidase)
VSGQPWGPDLSHWQGAPDFMRLGHAGASFVFLKASEGERYTDPSYARNHAAARLAGLFVGAYHFARPDHALGSAIRQADHFTAVTGPTRPGDLPPVLDLEQTGGLNPTELVGWASTFLARLRSRSGVRPILYTYSAFAADDLGAGAGVAGLHAYPLWFARYSRLGTLRPPKAPAPWAREGWAFWQHTDRARVPGVAGRCDRNVTRLSPAGLARLAGVHVSAPAHPGHVAGGTVTGGHVIPHPAPAHPVSRSHHRAPAPAVHTRTGGTVLGARELKEGCRGQDVATVQRFLGCRPVDGIYGPETRQEVKRYQRMIGLTPDGIVGPHTWAPILRALHQPAHRKG